jgi:hypothetical protein
MGTSKEDREKLREKYRARLRTLGEGGITGRDDYIVFEALATAITVLAQLPRVYRPDSHIDDMQAIFQARYSDRTREMFTQEAERRLKVLLERPGGTA